MKGIDVEERRGRDGRRKFLMAGGLVAVTGALGSIWALVAGAGLSAKSSATKRARWVKQVAHPTLNDKSADYQRFSGRDMFALYPQLKSEREGEGSFQKEMASNAQRRAKWMSEKKPGHSLPDYQLGEGAWTVMRSARPGAGLLAWTRVAVRTPRELGTQPYVASPEEIANTVKAAARLYGASLVGIAPMNESYVNLLVPRQDEKQKDIDIVFDEVDLPAATETKFTIPKKMKWVIAIAIPMDMELLSRVPTSLGDTASALGYSHSAFVVSSLAEFIRGLGYQAIPSVNDTAQSIPFAMDAGLGELSRLNKLVTPEFGPAVRLCKVFTDMPMAYDKPIDFGLAEYCKSCTKCADACPARALSFDREPSYNTRGVWNNPGHKTWYEDSYKCFQYWQKSGTACAVCLASCPYSKGDRAWIRDAAMATASITPAADGALRVLNDAASRGKPRDVEEWWGKRG